MGQFLAPVYFESQHAPCAVLPLFGRVLPLFACGCTMMWVCSEVPFDTCYRSAAFSPIAVDHDLACPAGQVIEGQAHSLFEKQYPMATANSGFGSSAGCRQNTFSTSPKFDGSNDDGAFSVANLAGTPRLCSILCANTSTKTNIAGPLVATSYLMCALGTQTIEPFGTASRPIPPRPRSRRSLQRQHHCSRMMTRLNPA